MLVVFQAANTLRKSQNTPASVFLVIKEVSFVLLHFHSTKPSSLICVCVWSVGWNSTAVETKQLKEQSQIFGIQGDVNSLLFGRKLFRTDEVPLHLRKLWSVRTANPELSVVIFLIFFFCSTVHEITGDYFLWAQHFVLASPLHQYFHTLPPFLTTAPFLFFSLFPRLDRPVGVGGGESAEEKNCMDLPLWGWNLDYV